MRISDWSSDVCSSDLLTGLVGPVAEEVVAAEAHEDGDEMRACRRDDVDGGAGQRVQRHGLGVDLLALPLPFCGDRGRARFGWQVQIGRSWWRERVCVYVCLPVVVITLKQKQTTKNEHNQTE